MQSHDTSDQNIDASSLNGRRFKGVHVSWDLINCGISLEVLHEAISSVIYRKDLSYRIWRILEKFEYAERLFHNPEDISRLLKKKEPKKVITHNVINEKKCNWCLGGTYILHDHHYPISKENGGLDTVSICASCHAEYHYLERSFQLSDKFLSMLEVVYE
jgi:hypothetical protein